MKMEMDNIILIIIGGMLIIGGVGFALANIDEVARKYDEERFGPLGNIGMGLGYILLRNDMFRWFSIIFAEGLGIVLVLRGCGFFS